MVVLIGNIFTVYIQVIIEIMITILFTMSILIYTYFVSHGLTQENVSLNKTNKLILFHFNFKLVSQTLSFSIADDL